MEDDLLKVIQAISVRLTGRGQSLAVAESCTGGFIANAITDFAGASRFFSLGVISYSAEAKHLALGVDRQTLADYGTVSEETAGAMSEGVRRICGATFGLATTGVAGPDTVEGKSVGLVFISCSGEGASSGRTLRLSGGREQIKRMAALEALRFFLEVIDSWE